MVEHENFLYLTPSPNPLLLIVASIAYAIAYIGFILQGGTL